MSTWSGVVVVLLLGLLALRASASPPVPLAVHQQEKVTSFIGERVVRFALSAGNDIAAAAAAADEQRRLETLKLIDRWAEDHYLDVWARSPSWIDVRVPGPTDVTDDELARLGVPYTVLIPDLQAEIDRERAQYLAVTANRSARALTADNFFETFRKLEEFDLFLDALVRDFPQLVTKKTIGTTIDGRPINCITIASAKNNRKVGFVYNGGQHAREWVSPMTNAFIAYQLVSLYGKDAEVTHMVDNIEWTIIPVLNCDGYVYSWTNNRMWRKNRRLNEDSWFGCYGIDLNRNWGYKWNTGGSSGDTCSDIYHGSTFFSEPETKAVANYVESQGNVRGYIDFHSYGQMWMSQWGWTTSEYPKDYDTQNELSKLAVAAIKGVHGKVYTYGPSAIVIYIASGGADDWTYGAANVTWSYSVEVRDTGRYGFLLPASEIVPTGEEIFAAVRVMSKYILERV